MEVNNSHSRSRGSGNHLRSLVESAILVGIAFALSYVRVSLPFGGSVTVLSMLPILLIGVRHGIKWGLGSGLVFAGLQMLQQFWAPPTPTFIYFFAVVMLDYVVAFTVLGLSGLFRGKKWGLMYASLLCLPLRFLSHFASGVLVWGYWATYWDFPNWLETFMAGRSLFGVDAVVWFYSIIYNGLYMGPELVITTIAAAILCKTAPSLFKVQPQSA